MAGSTTGFAPGIPIDVVTIPLVFDAYTNFTLVNPNTPLLSNSAGTLGAAGEATAKFKLNAGQLGASFVGTSVYHAFGLINPGGYVDFASNHVRVDLLP